jgi:TolA-binding protein
MSAETLHPEELLDRERRGALSDDDREALDTHCKHCAACALERRERAALAGEIEPEPEDDVLLERVIAQATTRAAPKRMRMRTVLIAVAAALLAASAIAAGVGALRKPAPPAPVETPAPPPALPEPVSTERAQPEPTAVVAPPEPSSSVKTVERVPTAGELFASATRARRDKNDAEAIRLYRELQRRYPDSRESQASRVVLGQLLLDRTDPEKALGEFDRYLGDGGTGTVTEEALVGRALALEKLGRREEERAAWRELLAKFPSSVHAAQARARLQASSD